MRINIDEKEFSKYKSWQRLYCEGASVEELAAELEVGEYMHDYLEEYAIDARNMCLRAEQRLGDYEIREEVPSEECGTQTEPVVPAVPQLDANLPGGSRRYSAPLAKKARIELVSPDEWANYYKMVGFGDLAALRKLWEDLAQNCPEKWNEYMAGGNGWGGSFEKPLHRAVRFGHLHVMDFLLEYGSPPDQKDKHGNTPLHTACFRANYLAAEKLLAKFPAAAVMKNTFDPPLTPLGWGKQTDKGLLKSKEIIHQFSKLFWQAMV